MEDKDIENFRYLRIKMIECSVCGTPMVPDDGYETIGRCMNQTCEVYNIPASIK